MPAIGTEKAEHMPGKVTLEVTSGPIKGETFNFEEHDIFIFGRDDDCHAKLSSEDTTASRHHFLLEVNPPDARVQDIGSRNGTYVNGVKHGGRPAHMTPEEARNLDYPIIDLKDGDSIKVGDTVFKVTVESPAVCCQCGEEIPDKYKKLCQLPGGLYACPDCREKVEKEGYSTKLSVALCNNCGKEVSAEIGPGRVGDYTCRACQEKAEGNTGEFIRKLMDQVSIRSVAKEGDITDYELGKELGKGGMGAVYLAKRKRDGKTVAIKTMLAKVAVDDYAREGFKREVDSTRSLSHPNIVTLYDFNYSGNLFFFALEYCAGGSIFDLMVSRNRVLSLKEAGTMFVQALDGLAYAHEKGFVHRDLKPQNILLTATTGGVAKVGDFGLAKIFEKAGLSGFTRTGEAAGTYAFMPKEQLTNFKYVKPPTDVWSMGATVYFMLTGGLPRDTAVGKSPAELVMRGQIVPIRRREPGIPKGVAEAIDRALANEPADRYQNAGEFRDALKATL